MTENAVTECSRCPDFTDTSSSEAFLDRIRMLCGEVVGSADAEEVTLGRVCAPGSPPRRWLGLDLQGRRFHRPRNLCKSLHQQPGILGWPHLKDQLLQA